jgi:hypothetical protein
MVLKRIMAPANMMVNTAVLVILSFAEVENLGRLQALLFSKIATVAAAIRHSPSSPMETIREGVNERVKVSEKCPE